ncbi:MAG: matrixin family metalloprotease [Candidatus ainarchaeum sp.]|nr:matrixin family metalloprotease [Candidatus ainarchaeum sp.]
MSRPVNPNNPGDQHYNDFAHEAGHMMGLNHSTNTSSIMNNTLATQPSQADLDGVAKAICGDNYCPGSCCCGNGVVDKDKGENCDPKANPTGCGTGASCCPVCCSCYSPLCIAANGEYLSIESCQSSCGIGASCYKNYKTGCWDCVKQTVVVTGTCRDPSVIRGNPDCDHVERSFVDEAVRMYNTGLMMMPVLGSVFSDERVNIITFEGDESHVVTEGGAVTGHGEGLLPDPTMTVRTDRETIRLVAGGEMTAYQAVANGKIMVEGNDFFSALRLGLYRVVFGFYSTFNPPEQQVIAEEGPELPQEYYDEMNDVNEAPPAGGEPLAIGEPPDAGYRPE